MKEAWRPLTVSYFLPNETVVPPANGSLSKVIPSSSLQMANQMVSKEMVDGGSKLPSVSAKFHLRIDWQNIFVAKILLYGSLRKEHLRC